MKKIICSIIFLLSMTALFADEGMWMLNTLTPVNWERMRKLGFTLPETALYDTINPSIKDAIVIFGGGCTGVTVSNKGLIFTNHHCGFDAIQSQSSVENDYLTNGFVAQTQEEELKIPGLEVHYLQYTKDVTDRLLASVDTIADEFDRLTKINQLSRQIEDSISAGNEFIAAEIESYYSNNRFYLNVYDVFKDVRMVFAPPSSVGKFGGDTDNWMWPRHTGDFSVFRVYANAENEPAEYSENNIPYTPRYFVPVSLDGYKEYDYAMTIGFPGSTDRYLSSWGVDQRVKSVNEPRIEARGIKQDIWKKAMLTSDEVRIKYASKFARSSNYWKNSIGMNKGIERLNVIERKQALEKEFLEWMDKNQEQKALFGNALTLVKEGYTESDESKKASTYLGETLTYGTEIVRLTLAVMGYDIHKPIEEREKYWNEKIEKIYKNYDPQLDQQVLAAMMRLAKERLPEIYLPLIYKEIDKKYKGDYDKYAEDVFKKSVVPHRDRLLEALKNEKKVKDLDKDPAYQLAKSVRETHDAVSVYVNTFYYDIAKGERLFLAGLKNMYPERDFYSDANFTMRMSYGSIAGYTPSDAVWYNYYTTQKGIFEKYEKDDPEFDVQDDILQLMESKDFGSYASKDGQLNLCFISNNDITGGNSGSPMFDGKGRLIGLAFDGNWEAMSGDIIYEPELQKTIGVDIRYVMFMIDKWGKCKRIIDELFP